MTMLKQWIPWKFLLKRTARAYGVIDPVAFLARLRRFAQPSEVQEPIELLRAGIEFHARGLINTKAIQHNLDWVWPFWVEKQFNPADPSFIPRAFSFSHVNLTHRNWTAVGLPTLSVYPIVDPRGLITPLFDGWSIDFWVLSEEGDDLIPSRLDAAAQSLEMDDGLAVRTRCRKGVLEVISNTRATSRNGQNELVIDVDAGGGPGDRLVVSLRPYNPEGIQFMERIDFTHYPPTLHVDRETDVHLSETPAALFFSNYADGDVVHKVRRGTPDGTRGIGCEVGMATAAALYPIPEGGRKRLEIRVPISEEVRAEFPEPPAAEKDWSACLAETAALDVPDERIRFLYDASVRALILLSAKDVVPGPYTYRRFWFRDACFMLNALMGVGLLDRSRRILSTFPDRQKLSGYFQSQEGEWDSNGQTLWIAARYYALTGDRPSDKWMTAILKGAEWIRKKRLDQSGDAPHAGLFPAGFSAEHLGPNDYYYWDDFWGMAGLKAVAPLVQAHGSEAGGLSLLKEGLDFERSIFKSIGRIPQSRTNGAIPAAPLRRMDAGAVGSLVADYPLAVTPPGDPGIMKTAEFLMTHCFQSGGFFQDMIHSGINAYLTLDIAQTLLRAGDDRYRDLIRAVADLATSTGNWPEAIHPRTWGGCMGDGHHGWAAAEWVMMIRSLFVLEEGDRLVIGAGLFPEWLETGQPLRFGPTPTPRGPVAVTATPGEDGLEIALDGTWRNEKPEIEFRVPGFEPRRMTAPEEPVHLARRGGETSFAPTRDHT